MVRFGVHFEAISKAWVVLLRVSDDFGEVLEGFEIESEKGTLQSQAPVAAKERGGHLEGDSTRRLEIRIRIGDLDWSFRLPSAVGPDTQQHTFGTVTGRFLTIENSILNMSLFDIFGPRSLLL